MAIRLISPRSSHRILSNGGVMRPAGRSGAGHAGRADRLCDSLVGIHASRVQLFAGAQRRQGHLVTFAFVSALIVFVSDYFRRATKRLEAEEQLRQLAVQELAHRLKNKIATIQAIISIQLREHPEIRKDILDHLQALSATDRLIEEANGQGAFARNIAETELG